MSICATNTTISPESTPGKQRNGVFAPIHNKTSKMKFLHHDNETSRTRSFCPLTTTKLLEPEVSAPSRQRNFSNPKFLPRHDNANFSNSKLLPNDTVHLDRSQCTGINARSRRDVFPSWWVSRSSVDFVFCRCVWAAVLPLPHPVLPQCPCHSVVGRLVEW